MAESADAADLKSAGPQARAGSSPALGTSHDAAFRAFRGATFSHVARRTSNKPLIFKPPTFVPRNKSHKNAPPIIGWGEHLFDQGIDMSRVLIYFDPDRSNRTPPMVVVNNDLPLPTCATWSFTHLDALDCCATSYGPAQYERNPLLTASMTDCESIPASDDAGRVISET